MLKNNKTSLIIAGIVIFFVIMISIMMTKTQHELSPVIASVPADASLVIESDNIPYCINRITKTGKITKEIAKSNLFKKQYKQLIFLDSLIKNNEDLYSFLKKKQFIISGHIIGESKMRYLFSASMSSKNEKMFKKIITSVFGDTTKFEVRKYDSANVVKVNSDFYYTFFDDFFYLSSSEILLEKAIRHLHGGVSLGDNVAFKNVYKSASNENPVRIYFSYDKLPQIVGKVFNRKTTRKFNLFKYFAEWTALELKLDNSNLQLSGFTAATKSSKYLSIFNKKTPEKINLLSKLPARTSAFVILDVGNGTEFKYKYQDFLADIKKINSYAEKVNVFNKKYGINKNNDFYTLINGEIAVVYQDINKNGLNNSIFAYVKTKDIQETKKYFDKLLFVKAKTDNAKAEKKDVKKYKLNYTANGTDYTISELPENKMLYMFFGVLFSDISANYYTIIDDYIVFGETEAELKRLIDTHEAENTFLSTSSDAEFINNLPEEANIYFYINIFGTHQALKQKLSSKQSKNIEKDIEFLSNITGPAILFIADSDPVYTIINIKYDEKQIQTNETVWEYKLDTLLASKPTIVINHNTNEKEIFVQDVNNKIYLIDKNGKFIWERQLSEKIISKVYQADTYKNNKLQLFFNTRNKIHLIDRNGNYIENYPVKLPKPATSGLALFDYDFDKNYRILIATNDKKMRLYNIKGEEIEGWKFGKTENIVTKTAKYFKHKKKDYVVFTDNLKIYILKRNGEIRMKPATDFPVGKNSEIFFEHETQTSKSRFVTTNTQGTVYFIYLNGDLKKMPTDVFTKNHYFYYADISGNGYNEFIYTDKAKTTVFNRDKQVVFDYTCPDKISEKQTVYKFSEDNVKVGLVSKEKNKIYLINKDGNLFKGFPLRGNSLFSISQMCKKEKFSVIVGAKNGNIYKYFLK